ncbi:helix-turn-helix domain-containing protein [Actinokineospora bangkokensis]|uniref:Uncharacterized protein n=1 Tax=Actinokineospora bangkokensis TaxID=1193682 RepID=A0A1Q9LFJ3_9PSEU|nr:hypothetical protein [Actinokineospora bangkokensis]OLR90807.1 hypothetical protein BJP25_30005 [Actinokineospora bangkokensis]
MTAVSTAADTRDVVHGLGGAFLTSPELAEQEAAAGQPAGVLRLVGRASALGAPTPAVATEALGVHPAQVVEQAHADCTLLAEDALAAYLEGLRQWSATALAGATTPDRTADLIFEVVDHAGAGGLLLFAGLRAADRPHGGPQRLGHALMLLRELRGGLHFAALRACGIPVPVALLADPRAEPLADLGWTPAEVDALTAAAAALPHLHARWEAAEEATNLRTDELLAVLGPARTELHMALLAI